MNLHGYIVDTNAARHFAEFLDIHHAYAIYIHALNPKNSSAYFPINLYHFVSTCCCLLYPATCMNMLSTSVSPTMQFQVPLSSRPRTPKTVLLYRHGNCFFWTWKCFWTLCTFVVGFKRRTWILDLHSSKLT